MQRYTGPRPRLSREGDLPSASATVGSSVVVPRFPRWVRVQLARAISCALARARHIRERARRARSAGCGPCSKLCVSDAASPAKSGAEGTEDNPNIVCPRNNIQLQIQGGPQLTYAYLSQRGYYPNEPNKPNQARQRGRAPPRSRAPGAL